MNTLSTRSANSLLKEFQNHACWQTADTISLKSSPAAYRERDQTWRYLVVMLMVWIESTTSWPVWFSENQRVTPLTAKQWASQGYHWDDRTSHLYVSGLVRSALCCRCKPWLSTTSRAEGHFWQSFGLRDKHIQSFSPPPPLWSDVLQWAQKSICCRNLSFAIIMSFNHNSRKKVSSGLQKWRSSKEEQHTPNNCSDVTKASSTLVVMQPGLTLNWHVQ